MQKQQCVGSFGDQQMSKVNDFCLIGSLRVLVAASSDRVLRVFTIEVKAEESKTDAGEVGDV